MFKMAIKKRVEFVSLFSFYESAHETKSYGIDQPV